MAAFVVVRDFGVQRIYASTLGESHYKSGTRYVCPILSGSRIGSYKIFRATSAARIHISAETETIPTVPGALWKLVSSVVIYVGSNATG